MKDKSRIQRGWENQIELSYWIPDADVEGTLPIDFCGSFIRNGPGINEVYGKKLKHPIDGDGMVCKVTFLNGKAHFSSKFIKTKQRLEEEKERKFIYMGQMGSSNESKVMGTMRTMAGLVTGNLPKLQFRNPSNTNAFYWGEKIITLYETQIPYCLDPYTLESLGPDDLNGHLSLKNAAPHFRIDPDTMNLVMISMRPATAQRQSSLEINEFDTQWNSIKKQMFHIKGLNYAHDFVLLPDYYVFHMTPWADASFWQVFKIYAGITSPGEGFRYHSHLPSRFIIVPRNSNSDDGVIQIDTDPCHIFHYGTAEQHGKNKISFNCVCFDKDFNMDSDFIFLGNVGISPGHLFNVDIDLDKRECKRVKIDRSSAEFPTTHPYRHGMTGTRYVYLMANDTRNAPYTDIIKVDTKTLARNIWHADGIIGEPVFAPRYGYQTNKDGSDEDDGYLLVQLYKPQQHKTHFCVLDAKNVEAGPIARIKLKHHVPYGFHGTYTPEVFLSTGPTFTSKL